MKKPKKSEIHKYTEAGLLEFEIKEFLPNKGVVEAPYFKSFLADRRKILRKSKNAVQFARKVGDFYRSKLGSSYTKDKVARPWELLRIYENKYKDKFPAYETPTAKKQGKVRDFDTAALERSRKKKDKGSGGKPYG